VKWSFLSVYISLQKALWKKTATKIKTTTVFLSEEQWSSWIPISLIKIKDFQNILPLNPHNSRLENPRLTVSISCK
jgi:hypothetical protein